MTQRFTQPPRGNLKPLRIVAAGLLTGLLCSSAWSYTYEERQEKDFSQYTVTDPDASYFDVSARMALLDDTSNSLLLGQMDRLQITDNCTSLMATPPLDERIRIPGFYPSPDAWREATRPLFNFEDDVSRLAGAYVATQNDYYSECLIKFLNKWAEANALWKFYYSPHDPQAWYSTESMMFAAALAYSIVRPRIEGMEEKKQHIDDWLSSLAKRHSAIPGSSGDCCNNHFYRRALYASMIGVLTDDDALFQYGVSAVYSALSDLTPEGGLPHELTRGRRATHYQNYALLYLVTNMQVIARQGYDIFNLEIDGLTIQDPVTYLFQIIDDPTRLEDYAPHEQYHGFLNDDQYFSWMEIYLHHKDYPRMERFLKQYRPLNNRSAGGYITLYFMAPEAQQRIVLNDSNKQRSGITIPDSPE
ncbi:alginate lyase family protein [Modicisalibacter radicis]|uniref:alginate lyase family protein n=1 Tax=Halomonas sp. EAR18 TaxID=2518972 RepID=UPI00109CE3B3|nr:alginate lyase family protein [Halomonas sp. EAR18]